MKISTHGNAWMVLLAGLIVLAAPAAGPLSAGQAGTEPEVEAALTRGEAFIERGAYNEALESFREAAGKAQLPLNRSRAFFGLSLGYFYLRDVTNARAWARRVVEVDPEKEISTMFYPSAFVELFREVKVEARPAADNPPAPPAPVVPAGSGPAAGGPSRPQVSIPQSSFLSELEGKIEVEFHYGSWGVGPVRKLIEDSGGDALGERIRDEVTKVVRGLGAPAVLKSYANTLALTAEGDNPGFALRFYPLGRDGVFSVGVAYEKTSLTFGFKGEVKNIYVDGTTATVNGEASASTAPWTAHMDFRWDFMGEARVSPFFVLGLGVGAFDGSVRYAFTGLYETPYGSRSVEVEEDLTFKEAAEKWDVSIPSYIPFLHLGGGLRVRIVAGLSLSAEAAIWNGFLLRGGVAYRF
jgi:hypothetical protein